VGVPIFQAQVCLHYSITRAHHTYCASVCVRRLLYFHYNTPICCTHHTQSTLSTLTCHSYGCTTTRRTRTTRALALPCRRVGNLPAAPVLIPLMLTPSAQANAEPLVILHYPAPPSGDGSFTLHLPRGGLREPAPSPPLECTHLHALQRHLVTLHLPRGGLRETAPLPSLQHARLLHTPHTEYTQHPYVPPYGCTTIRSARTTRALPLRWRP
jgi:hypothetical protein